jgi:YD repeat-containing protein
MRERLARWRRTGAAAVVLGLVATAPAATATENPFSINGAPQKHGSDSLMGMDRVDPLSGNLLLAHTDLELPGNAGFDLRVTRYYNSNIYRRFAEGIYTYEEPSWVGVGWRLHFGRVIHPDSQVTGELQIELPDGSRHPVYQVSTSDPWWRSADFFLYNPSTHVLKLPNGLVYTFGHLAAASDGGQLGAMRYVTEIRDPFNNTQTFSYFAAPGPTGGVQQIQQDLGDGQARTVTFDWDRSNGLLASMTYNGRTWDYQYQPSQVSGGLLVYVVLPRAGTGLRRWLYAYGGSGPYEELGRIVTPIGGEFYYHYDTVTRSAGGRTYPSRVVWRRQGPAGNWDFAYECGPAANETEVTEPTGRTIYRYNGVGTAAPYNVWRTGTLASRSRYPVGGSTEVERETFTYERSEPLVNVPVGSPSDPWYDDAVYRPLTTIRGYSRDGLDLRHTYFDFHVGQGTFNDYGQPWRIWQSPAYSGREIRRWFVPPAFFAPYILGRVSSEATRYSGPAGQFLDSEQTITNSGYDAATGFVTSVSTDTVTTTFTATARGNIHTSTNARGVVSTFDYAWGAVQRTETKKDGTTLALTVRTIPGPDPLPTSETVGVAPDTLTTSYLYDGLGRLRRVTPPGSTGSEPSPAPTFYEFDDNSQFEGWTSVRRGYSNPTVVTTYVDALGFPTRVETSGSGTSTVKATVQRDAEGREVFRSATYTAAQPPSRGTWTSYDALGRVTSVVTGSNIPSHPDYSLTTYAYQGMDTTVTDPQGGVTRYYYDFFSGPGDGRLVAVRDARNQCTYYRYRLGHSLTRAVGPGAAVEGTGCPALADPPPSEAGPVRTFGYALNTNRLEQEEHPESGVVRYGYDALGNVTEVRKQKADGTWEITSTGYDWMNRPQARSTTGSTYTVGWTYDGLGRAKVITGEVTTTYAFDATTGRLSSRTDSRPSGWSYTSAYAYDGKDLLTAITYPGGRAVGYSYDAQARLFSVTNNGAAFASSFQYDTSGRLASYVTGAVTQTVGYDEQDRVATIATTGLQGANLNIAYSHDRAGNVASVADGGVAQTFGYDTLHRLTSAAGPWGSLTWTYDPTGNRLSEDAGGATTVYHYNAANRLASTSSSQSESFTYDAFGRLTQDGQGTYTYRPDGAVLTAARTGMSANYTSDADGLRVERTVNGQRVVTVRGANGEVLSEFEATGCTGSALVWRRDLIYAGSRLLGSVKNASVRPSVAFAAAGSSAAENAASAPIAVQLTTAAPLGCPVAVSYQTHNGTAKAGQDYTAASGTVTFPAGSVNGATQTIAVSLLDDLVYEGAETVAVTLATPIGADLGAASSHTLTLAENEAVPSLAVADATVAEGPAATATFAVTLSQVCSQAVSVAYATANGTATAGQDYTATSGTLTIEAGTTSGTISVRIANDALFEANERFTVTLSSPTSPVTLSRATATGTIVDTQRPIDRVRRDAVTWQPTTGTWQVRRATDNYQTLSTYQWGDGALGDMPVPGDYDGDGLIDIAVWRRPTGVWYVLRSSTGYNPSGAQIFQWGGGTPTVTSGITVIGQPPSSPPIEGMWQSTGVTVAAGDVVTITASGTWTSGTAFTANGDPGTVVEGTNCPLSGAHLMALVGRIGASGAPFVVGAQGTVTATAAGLLYLAPNDTWYALWDNGGSLSVTVSRVEGAALTEVPVPADYDGDGKLDPATWRPATGVWGFRKSGSSYVPQTLVFGEPDDVPMPADQDADGLADLVVWRAFSAGWYAATSSSGYAPGPSWTWGNPAADCVPSVPVSAAPPSSPPLTAMWQGTGVTVTAGQTVSVTANGTWTSGTAFTANGDPATVVEGTNCPLSGAHLMALVGKVGVNGTPFLIGQARTFTAPASGELYLAPNDNWYSLWDNSGSLSVAVCVSATGAACDQAAPADYDGDRRMDPGVWRPTNGTWHLLRSTTGYNPAMRWLFAWGGAGEDDVPMPADYDGDGQADPAVWRGTTGVWYVLKSTGGYDAGNYAAWQMGTRAQGYQPVRVR